MSLILAPASELHGRVIIYHICNIGFIIFSVACAVSTNLGMLITFRFFQGCFSSAPVTNGTLYLPFSFQCPVDVDLLICSLCRRRHNCRPHRPGEARRCYCHLCTGTSAWASSWLEMGLLGPDNNRWILCHRLCFFPTRDLYNSTPQTQDSTSDQGNRKYESTFKTGQWSECKRALHSSYRPTDQDPDLVAHCLRHLNIRWRCLWISIPDVRDLHRSL